MKRNTWIFILLGLAIVVASPQLQAQINKTPGFTCDIAGAWVGSTPPIPYLYSIGQVITATITPTDPTGKRLADRSQSVNLDPTTGGMFPDANRASESMATYVKIGPETYQFTMITYLMKSPPPGVFERDQILYFFTMNGKAKCLDANTMKLTGTVSNWSNVDRPDLVFPPFGIYGVHDQDKDDDGLPDAGEVPIVSYPFEVTFKRLPQMRP